MMEQLTRAVRYKRYRKHTGVNLCYGMDVNVTVCTVDSVVCVCDVFHINTLIEPYYGTHFSHIPNLKP